jgi:hypothetical protein
MNVKLRNIIVICIVIIVFPLFFYIKFNLDIKGIERDIKKNKNVKSVNFLYNEGIFFIDEARLLITFNDNGWLLLDNISARQNNIILRACDGYEFSIFLRYNDRRAMMYGMDAVHHTSFSPEFYEKLFETKSLKSINDFVRIYTVIRDYMDSLSEITDDEMGVLLADNDKVWGAAKKVVTFNDIEYAIFKNRIKDFYLSDMF